MATRIPLEGGYAAIVDDDIAVRIARLRLKVNTKTPRRPRAFVWAYWRGCHRPLYLERIVTGADPSKFVQFRNDNTLDCRRRNLRVVGYRRDILDTPGHRAWLWGVSENPLLL